MESLVQSNTPLSSTFSGLTPVQVLQRLHQRCPTELPAVTNTNPHYRIQRAGRTEEFHSSFLSFRLHLNNHMRPESTPLDSHYAGEIYTDALWSSGPQRPGTKTKHFLFLPLPSPWLACTLALSSKANKSTFKKKKTKPKTTQRMTNPSVCQALMELADRTRAGRQADRDSTRNDFLHLQRCSRDNVLSKEWGKGLCLVTGLLCNHSFTFSSYKYWGSVKYMRIEGLLYTRQNSNRCESDSKRGGGPLALTELTF